MHVPTKYFIDYRSVGESCYDQEFLLKLNNHPKYRYLKKKEIVE